MNLIRQAVIKNIQILWGNVETWRMQHRMLERYFSTRRGGENRSGSTVFCSISWRSIIDYRGCLASRGLMRAMTNRRSTPILCPPPCLLHKVSKDSGNLPSRSQRDNLSFQKTSMFPLFFSLFPLSGIIKQNIRHYNYGVLWCRALALFLKKS